MKAVILVGGKATRLEPLTINTPKAILPVLNTPFLEYLIRHLARHQIRDIILASGHLSHPIQDYLGDGSQLGVNLYYSIEDIPLGSAGAAKKAEKYLDETFLVLNGDIFADMDFTVMLGIHQERKAKVTIALTPVDDPTSFGLVDTDMLGRVTRFLEKPKTEEVTTNMINAGAWFVEPDVLTRVPPQTFISFERNVFPELLDQGEPFYSYHFSGYWMDMGTPEKYLQLHRDLLSGKSSHYITKDSNEVITGEQCEINSAAQIRGPVIIGANCFIGYNVKLVGPVVIGDNCTIKEGSVIEDSIIWRNVRLEPKVQIKTSVVANNCHLNAESLIEECILADDVTVVGGIKLKSGSRIEPGIMVEISTWLSDT